MTGYGRQTSSRISRQFNSGTFIVESPLSNGGRITIELPIDVTHDDIIRAARILEASAPPEPPKQITPRAATTGEVKPVG